MTDDMHATDIEWEKWGSRDPYFGVLTHDRYRSSTFSAADYNDFFESGREQVSSVLASCKRHFGDDFRPARVLDFGCGVGRVLIPFAEVCESVVGLDVSESMLAEARRNCARFSVTNAMLVQSDDRLSGIDGPFDLVHSTIVLQHIESERGLDIIARLVDLIAPGGAAAIHVTYGRNYGHRHYGQPVPVPPEVPPTPSLRGRVRTTLRSLIAPAFRAPSRVDEPPEPVAASKDPIMMMYLYDLNRIAYVFHAAGAPGYHAEFTDHGGELGVMFYVRPAPDRSRPHGFELAPARGLRQSPNVHRHTENS